jgi:glycine cleavage system aminomethyltransferase T
MVDSLLTSTLEPYASTLSVLLNEQGGIIDDMMITKHASDALQTRQGAQKTWRGSRRGYRSGTPVSARKAVL